MKVYETKDYSRFRKLAENRDVSELRVKRIMNSILSVGWVTNPIIVNEKMEVVDGQGRLEALRRLGMPVQYVVSEGADITACQSMNANMKNWTMNDFIKSFAQSNTNYTYLVQLQKEFGGQLTFATITAAVDKSMGGTKAKVIKEGRFICTADDYDLARKTLEYTAKFVPVVGRMTGRKEFYYIAIGYCYRHPAVNNGRLLKAVTARQAALLPAVSVETAIAQLENAYNWRTARKLYISADWRKEQDERKADYNERWRAARK